MKILIACGSSPFKFNRLYRFIDELCDEGVIDKNGITAQTGYLDYKIKNYEHYEYIPYSKMAQLTDEADLIICHAGTGTTVGALKKGKKVIVFPRLKDFEEHESNHQLDLAKDFAEEGYVLYAYDKESLKKAIESVDSFVPKKFESNTENFVNLIRSLL